MDVGYARVLLKKIGFVTSRKGPTGKKLEQQMSPPPLLENALEEVPKCYHVSNTMSPIRHSEKSTPTTHCTRERPRQQSHEPGMQSTTMQDTHICIQANCECSGYSYSFSRVGGSISGNPSAPQPSLLHSTIAWPRATP